MNATEKQIIEKMTVTNARIIPAGMNRLSTRELIAFQKLQKEGKILQVGSTQHGSGYALLDFFDKFKEKGFVEVYEGNIVATVKRANDIYTALKVIEIDLFVTSDNQKPDDCQIVYAGNNEQKFDKLKAIAQLMINY